MTSSISSAGMAVAAALDTVPRGEIRPSPTPIPTAAEPTWASSLTATFAALERGVLRAKEAMDLDLQDLGRALPRAAGPRQRAAIARPLTAIEEHESTALFIHTDEQAVPVLDAALARGWRVLAADATVPISAISPAKHELGARAVELLHRRIEDRSHTAPIEQATLLPRLHVRATSGPPRAHRRGRLH
ncbi:substrate-binding domain-containing protein [Occultella kanbiaonis]|uniref:substrate-binding domain-containing protein n=1 Tax=Occultella kanbiaonis TaxID=2675754 RepID=UPI0013CFF81F|nr:substrate-binding domain-containing protein [Occultella kanbiaonis]